MTLTNTQIYIVIGALFITSVVFLILYFTKKCAEPKQVAAPTYAMRSPQYSTKKSSEYKRSANAPLAAIVGSVPVLSRIDVASGKQAVLKPEQQHLAKVKELPKNFDWRNVTEPHKLHANLKPGNYCSDIKNQHSPVYGGTCWIFSSLQVMADRFHIMNAIKSGNNNTPKIELAVQQVVNCGGPNIGALTGGDSDMCYNFVVKNKGIVDATCQPYTALTERNKCKPECYTCLAVSQNKCSEIGETEFTSFGNKRCCKVNNYKRYSIEGYSNISARFKNEKSKGTNGWSSSDTLTDYIKTEIYSFGPVTIALDATPIETAKGPKTFVQKTSRDTELNHLVSIVGYGNDGSNNYWIIRNSWGTFWADDGYLNIDINSIGLDDKNNDFFACYPTGYSKVLGVKEEDIQIKENFDGVAYRLAGNWFDIINIDDYKNRPINYLEIGTFYGANLLSVEKTYGENNNSRLYCIDPWEDYDEYPEYKNSQPQIYDSFIKNIETSGKKEKIIIKRGYSNIEIPKLPDDFFDIIYIDGNHEPEYVLEDAVLSFRKLKKGGFMIFDDYGWGGPDLTQKGIDAFISGYYKKLTNLGENKGQMFIKKL